VHLFRQKATVPSREIADCSAEERNRLSDAFISSAIGYRRHRRIAIFAMGGFAASILLAMILPKSLFLWLLSAAAILLIVVLSLAVSAPSLACPGCCNDIERSFGRYCPECGNRQLQQGNWFRSTRCAACGKTMGGKGRSYKIRACTHCGLILDEKGL